VCVGGDSGNRITGGDAKLGGGSASIPGTSVYRGSKWGRKAMIVRRPQRAQSDRPTTGDRGAALTLVRLESCALA